MTIWQKIGLYLTAARIRFRSATPVFFQTISDFAIGIYGLAVLLQPNVLEAINIWAGTGLHPLPWLSQVSSGLAGLAAGAQLVAKLTANLATLSKSKIEKINPTQPEIAEELKPS